MKKLADSETGNASVPVLDKAVGTDAVPDEVDFHS